MLLSRGSLVRQPDGTLSSEVVFSGRQGVVLCSSDWESITEYAEEDDWVSVEPSSIQELA